MEENVGSVEDFQSGFLLALGLWGSSAAGWWYVLCLSICLLMGSPSFCQLTFGWPPWWEERQWGFSTVAWVHPPTDNWKKTDESMNTRRSWTWRDPVYCRESMSTLEPPQGSPPFGSKQDTVSIDHLKPVLGSVLCPQQPPWHGRPTASASVPPTMVRGPWLKSFQGYSA